MAEQVVGLLEMIEVDAEQGEAVALGLCLVDGLIEMLASEVRFGSPV
jgi:hypothetical protein